MCQMNLNEQNFASQHNVYCVIRRQEDLCFGQTKHVHGFETSGHV